MARTVRTTKRDVTDDVTEAPSARARAGKAFQGWLRKKPTRNRHVLHRVAAGTTKATVHYFVFTAPGQAKRAARKARNKIDRELAARRGHEIVYDEDHPERTLGGKIIPDPTKIHKRRFGKRSFTCFSCSTMFGSAELLNQHFMIAHANETMIYKRRVEQPALHLGTTAKTQGKVLVKPVKGKPVGRHRTVAKTPEDRRAAKIVAANRARMDKIGARAMAGDSTAANLVSRGFAEYAAGATGKLKLSQIEADALGMEKALHLAAEHVKSYKLKLVQAGFDPGDIQNLTRASDSLTNTGAYFANFIATLKENLAHEIKAAQARKAGASIDDQTLTS